MPKSKLAPMLFIVVVALIFFFAYQKKAEDVKKEVINGDFSLESCESRRSLATSNGDLCVKECVLETEQMNLCIYGFRFDRTINSYVYYESLSSCNIDDKIYKCLYPSSSCNTLADTNCDQCVAYSELISLADKWIQKTASYTDLVNSATQWIARDKTKC